MKKDGKTSYGKKSRRKSRSEGKIAGQGMKKDSVTTLLFQANNENFAELFNRTLLAGQPVLPEELDEENIKETAYVRITKEGGGTTLVQYRDVVKGVRNEKIFAVLGIEHQSEIDYAMPYRVLELDFVNYARQMQIIRERHEAEWKAEKGQKAQTARHHGRRISRQIFKDRPDRPLRDAGGVLGRGTLGRAGETVGPF